MPGFARVGALASAVHAWGHEIAGAAADDLLQSPPIIVVARTAGGASDVPLQPKDVFLFER